MKRTVREEVLVPTVHPYQLVTGQDLERFRQRLVMELV